MIPITLFVLTTYSLACMGMGVILVKLLRGELFQTASAMTIVATIFLVGQGILANVWVFVAMAGKFSPLVVWGIVLFLILSSLQYSFELFTKAWKQGFEVTREVASETLGWKILIIGTITIWASWAHFLGRPIETPGTRFYMALPKVISASEKLKVLPGYEDVTSLGLQGEMQFAALMSMGSPESTQLFSWLTLTAGCILLLALGRQVGLNRRGQWLALSMVFTSSAVVILSGSGKTDVYGAAFGLAAYYWAFNLKTEKQYLISILIGMLAGMAVVAKLSYAGSFLPSLAFILIWNTFSNSGDIGAKPKIAKFFVTGISAALIVLQLPIKNLYLFNSLIAPFGMEDIVNQVWYGPETIWKVYLALPLSLTFGAFWAQAGGISPLILVYSPLLLFLPKPRQLFEKSLVILSIASLFGLGIWFLLNPSNFAPRYFLACLLILVIPAANAAERFATLGREKARIIQTAALLFITYTSLSYTTFLFVPGNTLSLLFSGKPNCNIEPMRCEIITNVNLIMGSGERLFTNTRHRYWLRPDLIQCAATSEEINNFLSIESPEFRWKYLVGRGFHSVFVENRGTPLPSSLQTILNEIPYWLSVSVIENSNRLIYFQIELNDDYPILYYCEHLNADRWNIIEYSYP